MESMRMIHAREDNRGSIGESLAGNFRDTSRAYAK